MPNFGARGIKNNLPTERSIESVKRNEFVKLQLLLMYHLNYHCNGQIKQVFADQQYRKQFAPIEA